MESKDQQVQEDHEVSDYEIDFEIPENACSDFIELIKR